MMISNSYANTIEAAKPQNSSPLNLNKSSEAKPPAPVQQDTVTISKQAQGLLQGSSSEVKETASTYKKPELTRELLTDTSALATLSSTSSAEASTADTLLDEIV